MMSPSPLDQLADIHAPASTSIWPLAPIYWIAMIAITLIGLAIYVAIKRRKQTRYRRQGEVSLEQAWNNFTQNQKTTLFIETALITLKQTAKYVGASPEVLAQPNSRFVSWLKATSPDSATLWNDEVIELMTRGLYQKNPQGDVASLLTAAQHWMHNHDARLIKSTTAEVSHV